MAGFRRALICVLVLLTSHCYINAANTTVPTSNAMLPTANTTLPTTDTTQPDSTTTTTSTTNSQITNQTTTERNNSQSSTTTQQTSTTVLNNPQTNTSISASTSNNQTITGVSVQNTSTTGDTSSTAASTATSPVTGSQATAQTTLTVTSSVITQTLTRTLQTTKATQSISLSTQNETTSQSTASETTSQSTVSATAPQSLVNVTAPQSILNETTSQSTVSATAPQSLVNVTTSQSSVNESTSTSIQNKSTSHRSVSELNSQFTSNSSGGSSTPTPTDVSANSSGVRRDTTSKSIELSTSETTTQTDRCRSSPCQNNGTCVNGVNTYNCNCKSGWEGKNCTVESDSCLTVDRNCTKPNERCVNKPGYQNFSCECLPKYYKKDGDCIKESLYKFELRYEEKYKRAYNDRTSTAYKDKVKEIEAQVRNLNESLISDVTVKSLRKGSVIAKTFVTAKASQLEIEQYLNNSTLNATKQNLTAADYCIDIYHDCDTVSTDCVPREKGFYCKCKEDFKAIPQTTKYCMDMRRKTCSYNVCKHQGTCAINGPEIVCSCTEERTGKYCQERVVKKSNYDRLVKIFIGVTAGLGSLTLFFFLALIVFCCTEKKDQKYSSTSREPIDDDITIHNWMPSLPRPKIKPGSFADDSMEMNESQPIKRPTVRPQPGTDNPAFIPEADYDLDKYEGRHAINGKRNDYVYL